jgi:hypothetical protein
VNLLARLQAEIARDPGIMVLWVVQRALKELEQGSPDVVVIANTLSIDADKFIGPFHDWLMEVLPIAQAHQAISTANAVANEGRGSGTARAMCQSLARFDLNEARAIFLNDGDKIRQYPEVERAITSSIVGCRLHHKPYYCDHWLCLLRKSP